MCIADLMLSMLLVDDSGLSMMRSVEAENGVVVVRDAFACARP